MDLATALKYKPDGDAPRERGTESADQCRKYIRAIQQHPILSREWLDLVGALRVLARSVHRDLQKSKDAEALDVAGRDAASAGTLWDQETSETAVRVLVEEAKVSLCLRMMHEYKVWDFDERQRTETLALAMQAHNLGQAQTELTCRSFEQSLGVLLWRSLAHVETLQLTDITLLIEHCAMVLDYCDRHVCHGHLDAAASLQDTAVLFYVASLFTHAEALNNTELLAKAREVNLLPLLVSHIRRHAKTGYPPEMALEVAKGLAALCDNEDFPFHFSAFFDSLDPDEMRAFVELQDVLVAPILAADRGVQKVLRPLTDFLDRLRRRL